MRIFNFYLILILSLLITQNISAQYYTITKKASIDGSYIQLKVELPKRYDKVLWSNGMEGRVIKVPTADYDEFIVSKCTCPNGCKTELGVYVSKDDIPKIKFKKADESCYNMKDGRIKVIMPSDYKFQKLEWSDGKKSGQTERKALSPGVYSLTITGELGNVRTETFTIEEKQAYVLNEERISRKAPLKNKKKGEVQIAMVEGDKYEWSTGQNSSFVKLPYGDHSLKLTNGNRCSILDFSVDPYEPLEAAVEVVSHVKCRGGYSGAVELSVKGGQGPYLVKIGGQEQLMDKPTILMDSLSEGTHKVVVKDVYGNKEKLKLKIKAPKNIEINLEDLQHPTCSGQNDGAVSFSTAGGGDDLDIGLYDGNNQFVAPGIEHKGLQEGVYTVKVVNQDGCEFSEKVSLKAPKLEAYLEAQSPSCHRLNDGWLEVETIGGAAPFTFDWLGQGEGGKRLSDLEGGEYACKIKDSKGCTVQLDTILQEPKTIALKKSDIKIKKPTCFGRSNGSITIDLKERGLTCHWLNTEQKSRRLAAIPAGTYQVLIEKGDACAMHEIELTEPPTLELSLDVKAKENGFHVSCHGAADGEVVVKGIDGGNSDDYQVRFGGGTYQWNQDSHNLEIKKLKPGKYPVKIKDTNGCSFKDFVIINEPPPIKTITNVSTYGAYNIKCKGENNGRVEAKVEGISDDFKYVWYNQKDSVIGTASVLENLSKGRYRLEVKDNYGCKSETKIKLNEPPRLAITSVKSDFKMMGIVMITTEVRGGHGTYDFYINGEEESKVELLNTEEHYTISVKDELGCSDIRADVYFNEPKRKVKSVGAKPKTNNSFTGTKGRQKCPAWKKTFGKKVLQWIVL